jgi:hypothetical protein
MPTEYVPLTLAPSVGRERVAVKDPVEFETVTERDAVAVCPLPSLTVNPSVWLPFVAPTVFHA